MKQLSIIFLSVITLFMASACSDEGSSTSQSATSAGIPAGHQGGVVKRSTHAGGYTYVQVDMNGKDVWVAGPSANIQRGQTVSWTNASLMKNFTSSTLRRTFDEILFIQKFETVQ